MLSVGIQTSTDAANALWQSNTKISKLPALIVVFGVGAKVVQTHRHFLHT